MSETAIIKVLLFLISLSLLVSCSSKDDTGAIHELVQNCAELAEEHNVKDILKLTSDNFYALPNHHDREGVRKILWWAFRQYGKFQILYPEPAIELSEKNQVAIGRIYFMIVKKDQPYPALKKLYHNPEAWLEEVGKKADLYQLDVNFSKSAGTWYVVQAELKPFTGLGFAQ